MRIHVGRLSASLSESDLRNVFEAYGRVVAVSLVRRGPRRHAFVDMVDAERARAAIDGLSRTWAVSPARLKPETQADFADFAR